jgi:hypothetical protein
MIARLPLTILLLAAVAVSLCAACTQPSCSTGTYGAIPGFTPTSNGCGSYGVSVDAPFGVTPCCNQHDICYHSCSTSKSDCDDRFDQCMKDVCDSEDDLEKIACRAQAELFYQAVMDLGCRAYLNNQEAGCQCSDGSIVTSPGSFSSANGPAVSTLLQLANSVAGLIM